MSQTINVVESVEESLVSSAVDEAIVSTALNGPTYTPLIRIVTVNVFCPLPQFSDVLPVTLGTSGEEIRLYTRYRSRSVSRTDSDAPFGYWPADLAGGFYHAADSTSISETQEGTTPTLYPSTTQSQTGLVNPTVAAEAGTVVISNPNMFGTHVLDTAYSTFDLIALPDHCKKQFPVLWTEYDSSGHAVTGHIDTVVMEEIHSDSWDYSTRFTEMAALLDSLNLVPAFSGSRKASQRSYCKNLFGYSHKNMVFGAGPEDGMIFSTGTFYRSFLYDGVVPIIDLPPFDVTQITAALTANGAIGFDGTIYPDENALTLGYYMPPEYLPFPNPLPGTMAHCAFTFSATGLQAEDMLLQRTLIKFDSGPDSYVVVERAGYELEGRDFNGQRVMLYRKVSEGVAQKGDILEVPRPSQALPFIGGNNGITGAIAIGAMQTVVFIGMTLQEWIASRAGGLITDIVIDSW